MGVFDTPAGIASVVITSVLVTSIHWYLLLGMVIAIAGTIRLMLSRDLVARLIALDVTGIGALVILVALSARSEEADPVLSALVITGLVIAVAFTGLGAVLIRRIEGLPDGDSTTGDGAEWGGTDGDSTAGDSTTGEDAAGEDTADGDPPEDSSEEVKRP